MRERGARVSQALEMATEIYEDHERLYAVAIALNDRLKPARNGDGDPTAARLAEVLEEMMRSTGQLHPLIDCLKAMQAGAA